MASNDKQAFLEALQHYKSFFKSLEQTFLTVKQNSQWNLLCDKIELSNYDKPLSEKEIYTIHDRLLVIQKAERFDIDILTNIANVYSLCLMNKNIDLSNLHSFTLKTFDIPRWTYYGYKNPEGWSAMSLLACSTSYIDDVIVDVDALEEQIKIYQTDPSDDLNALSEKYLGFSAMKRDVCRLYISFPFYKKIEITEFSGSKLKALFKCHKLLDISSIRISMHYFKSGTQIGGSNAVLKDPKVLDKEFLEFQVKENKIYENVDFVKMYIAHNDKPIQKYHYEKPRQQKPLFKTCNESPLRLPEKSRIKNEPTKRTSRSKLVDTLSSA